MVWDLGNHGTRLWAILTNVRTSNLTIDTCSCSSHHKIESTAPATMYRLFYLVTRVGQKVARLGFLQASTESTSNYSAVCRGG